MKAVIGLNNGLHNVPARIDAGRSCLAPLPFNNNNNIRAHTKFTELHSITIALLFTSGT